jgi:hypothetical protein
MRKRQSSSSFLQAVKKAKQFAVRKFGRRLVDAKEKSDVALVAKIESQLAAVKEACHAKLAEAVSVKQLRITDEPSLPSSQPDVEDAGAESTQMNDVINRQLVQAKCVQDAVTHVQVQCTRC